MKCSQEIKESPESTVVPYEDIDTKQVHISGEKFPGVILGMCDNCHWCYTAGKIKVSSISVLCAIIIGFLKFQST